MRRSGRAVILAMLMALTVPLFAQNPKDPVRIDTASVLARPDSVLRADSTGRIKGPTKSTATAMLLSAVFPGGGQLYNQSYWKVPIVAGLGVYFISELLNDNRLYKDYRSQYDASITAQLPSGNPRLLSLRDFYHDERDTFGWYFLILYVINIADAYVDASLFDFDVGSDLSLRVMPEAWTPAAPGPRLALRLQF
jgi:Family of unknown function (DUF5683)